MLVVWVHAHIIKKYGEKDAREACQLNLYPMANHGIIGPNI
jgi:hypothetical protein